MSLFFDHKGMLLQLSNWSVIITTVDAKFDTVFLQKVSGQIYLTTHNDCANKYNYFVDFTAHIKKLNSIWILFAFCDYWM